MYKRADESLGPGHKQVAAWPGRCDGTGEPWDTSLGYLAVAENLKKNFELTKTKYQS